MFAYFPKLSQGRILSLKIVKLKLADFWRHSWVFFGLFKELYLLINVDINFFPVLRRSYQLYLVFKCFDVEVS